MDKEILAPGDSTELEIIFSTKSYTRTIVKSPKITTNEGPPDRRVRIETTVVETSDSTSPVIITPCKIDISQFSHGIIDRKSFAVRNVSDRELTLNLLAGPLDMMEIDLPQSVGPGETVEGEVRLHADVLDISFDKSFTFELNDDDTTRFTVPVTRTIHTPASGTREGVAGCTAH